MGLFFLCEEGAQTQGKEAFCPCEGGKAHQDVGIRIAPPGEAAEEQKIHVPGDDQYDEQFNFYDIHRVFKTLPCWQLVPGSDRFRKENGTSRRADEICVDGFSSSKLAGTNSGEEAVAADGGGSFEREGGGYQC
ncbi:hypothetical protein F511_47349 [Dorcoceras hygrometricum]|uniref:Uncharacterized protein n=1 Tax=Dorcoceras hygrometricum TaxID=472368 RepID=A0A2Z6ZRC0_9LAMI|nr:hypothetical protein F511_47349 [Dorcoceras hygrometricum]